MSIPNNPAGRLYEILKKGRGFGPVNGDNQRSVRDAWAHMLGVEDPKDTAAILVGAADVMALPDAILKRLSGTAIDEHTRDVCTRWVPNIHQLFSRFDLRQHWREAQELLSPEVLLSLEMCHSQLSQLAPEVGPLGRCCCGTAKVGERVVR